MIQICYFYDSYLLRLKKTFMPLKVFGFINPALGMRFVMLCLYFN
jgi:hypothetical protein